jgi:carbamoyltransferase
MSTGTLLGLASIHGRLAVALVRDGEVVFAVEEDKLRRFRGLGLDHLADMGSRALDLALERVPGGLGSIARVAFVPSVDAVSGQVSASIAGIAGFLERHYGRAIPIDPVDHVEAHMALERSVHLADQVFMLGRSRAVYSAGPGGPHEMDIPCHLVRGVERLAAFAGFPPARIHHLENMARFGKPRFVDAFERLMGRVSDPGEAASGLDASIAEATGLRRRLPSEPLAEVHYDFAASLYHVLETGTIALLGSVPPDKRRGTIAVCGGVFQSWTLNDAVAAAFPESRIIASFVPGNAAGAIGGPLVLSGKSPKDALGPYLGPEYSRQDIKAVLDNTKVPYALHPSRETIRRVCQAIEEGQMVGWFQGRCEFGYRALGSRSVFASPGNPYACDNLSSYLKKRPAYFAYAVAIEGDDPRVANVDSPYLSRSAVLDDYFGESPVRIQSVSRKLAPSLWQLLQAFRQQTGVSALLNTSLNYFDEPIACTPRDALKTFFASGLDMLVMEDFLLTKR